MIRINKLFKDWQDNRTQRVIARQQRRISRTQSRQERRSVESLTGMKSGSGEAWASAVGGFLSPIAGIFGGNYSTYRPQSSSAQIKSQPIASDNSSLIYAGIGVLVLVAVVVIIFKMKKK